MLKVGSIGFGGGSALIPVMERELVNDRGGLTSEAFTQDTVIASITPGALPVKLAALSGARLGGICVALASAMAVALPGAVLTVGLLAFFAALGPDGVHIVELASLGVTAFILFLLGHYVIKVLRPEGRWRLAAVLIAVCAFLLTGLDGTVRLIAAVVGAAEPPHLPALSALGLVVLALVVVAAVTVVQRVRSGPPAAGLAAQDTAASRAGSRRFFLAAGVFGIITVVLIVAGSILPGGEPFSALVAASTVSSFGGGEAYVGVADGYFVAPGIVDDLEFYAQIIPVANALPGPILVKVAAGMGFMVGSESAGLVLGLVLAVVALAVSVAACSAIALGVLGGYAKASRSRFVGNVAAVILPVVCGLLASTAVSMLHASVMIGAGSGFPAPVVVAATIALSIVVAIIHVRLHAPDLVLIVGCALLSLGAAGLATVLVGGA